MAEKNDSHYGDYKCMLRLVTGAVNNTVPDLSGCRFNWGCVYMLSMDTSLVSCVSYGVDLLPPEQKPPQDIVQQFVKNRTHNIIKDSNQIVELQQLQDELEKQGVDNIAVKGSVMKPMYPQTDMRYMGDLDILVKNEGVASAKQIISRLGYSVSGPDGEVHIEYTKMPYLIIELHKNLLSKENMEYDYFHNIWDRATLINQCEHTYTPALEDTYIYMNVHAVKHYFYGGLAPRIVLDYYVFLEKYNKQLNWQYINKVLNKFGYTRFEKVMTSLSYDWFSPTGKGLAEDELSMFIMTCGSYGRLENNVALRSAMQTKAGKTPSKAGFFIRQVFPNKKALEGSYPIVGKVPVVLPFIWCRRIFDRLFIKRNVSFQTRGCYSSINTTAVEKFRRINNDLGLDDKNK
ncbi:MAG TPA: nucleotidyltransferase family protein [Clostridiales bacterium]|nr:nucleotidyltransferase family protein [Clostridiales bacterium]